MCVCIAVTSNPPPWSSWQVAVDQLIEVYYLVEFSGNVIPLRTRQPTRIETWNQQVVWKLRTCFSRVAKNSGRSVQRYLALRLPQGFQVFGGIASKAAVANAPTFFAHHQPIRRRRQHPKVRSFGWQPCVRAPAASAPTRPRTTGNEGLMIVKIWASVCGKWLWTMASRRLVVVNHGEWWRLIMVESQLNDGGSKGCNVELMVEKRFTDRELTVNHHRLSSKWFLAL